MNGNFSTVLMMIFLPLSMNFRRSPEWVACPTVALTWAKSLMVAPTWSASSISALTQPGQTALQRMPRPPIRTPDTAGCIEILARQCQSKLPIYIDIVRSLRLESEIEVEELRSDA